MKTTIFNVLKEELKKLCRMPVFYILSLMCVGFNIYMLEDGLSYKMDRISYYQAYMQENPEGYAEEYGYDSYATLNMEDVFIQAKYETNYDSFTDRLVRGNYNRLQNRADTMTEEEQNSLSITGENKLHEFLFGDYMKWILAEGMLIITLVVIYSLHFEVYHQTEELTLCTKIGNKLFPLKLLTSGAFSAILCFVVAAISLGIYFTMVDYSHIWGSYISSNYNMSKRTVNDLILYSYPYVTWLPMTIRQYFWATVGMISILWLFTILLVGASAKRIKNSITLLILIVIDIALMYLFGNLVHFPNMLEYVCKFNPIHLITKCGYWFMDYAPGDTYPLYEVLTAVVWTVVTGVVCFRVMREEKID